MIPINDMFTNYIFKEIILILSLMPLDAQTTYIALLVERIDKYVNNLKQKLEDSVINLTCT